MLEYEFEQVKCVGGILSYSLEFTNHREIIRKRAADGWHFAGCIPAIQRRNGLIETIDLVFERETAEKEL